MIVAQITKDHLWTKWNEEGGEYNSTNHKDKIFESDALRDWWGWNDQYDDNYFEFALEAEGKTTFKLYDDDGELYYEGWLIDDEECMAQQFVLGWAEADSGCTTIKVHRASMPAGEGGGSYVQEIG